MRWGQNHKKEKYILIALSREREKKLHYWPVVRAVTISSVTLRYCSDTCYYKNKKLAS